MKVSSNEITYRTVINQVFFEDGTELVITTGWAEGQEYDLDYTLEWVSGEVPEWANSLSDADIMEAVRK